MRDLMATRNVMEIKDPVSGDIHEFHFRMPTNAERLSLQAALAPKRENGRLVIRSDSMGLYVEHGKALLTGFRKGTFGMDGKPFSSDQADPDYRADWRDLLAELAPDLVAVLAQQVFDGARVVPPLNLEYRAGESAPGAGEVAEEPPLSG